MAGKRSGGNKKKFWTDFAEAMASFPSRPEPGKEGDKSILGQIDNVLGAAWEAVGEAEDTSVLRSLLDRLSEFVNRLILDEYADAPGGVAFVFDTGESLRAAAEKGGEVELVETCLQELNRLFPPPEFQTAETLCDDEKAPPLGEVSVASQEDYIIYSEFITESSEHLERIEAGALELETGGSNADLINDMFRCFHSMKGAAGFLGLTSLNNLCHGVEGMLDRLRKLTLRVDTTVVEILLASIDLSKKLLASLQLKLDSLQGGGEAGDLPTIDIRPILHAVDDVISRKPAKPVMEEEDVNADLSRMGGILVAEGKVTEKQLAEALQAQKRPLGKILVDMGAVSEVEVESALTKQAETSQKRGGSIKVDTERLDALLEMVGELVISQSQVESDPALATDLCRRLAKNVANMTKITDNLQSLSMAMRMIPLRQTFNKMMRLVRDTAVKTGKDVRLEITGEETEIDKTVVEQIADPLVHLLRNAVDHGVELPEVREEAGKPRQGVVQLKAFQEGGNVVIEIRDDGKGLDRDKLLAKAISKGLAREGENYTDDQVFEFIFAPGFSTHEVATDISGRGVGMDVVRRNITALGGRTDVHSRKGKGSSMIIRLPLTMAIVDGMIVEVGSERYVLPTLSIVESIKPLRSNITLVSSGRDGGESLEVLSVRGDLVPLINLGRLFRRTGAKADAVDGLVIVISDEGRRCGLVVDELLGQQQVVIKNLGPRMKGLVGVSGGCIMGDGRVGLILDVPGLIHLAGEKSPAMETCTA